MAHRIVALIIAGLALATCWTPSCPPARPGVRRSRVPLAQADEPASDLDEASKEFNELAKDQFTTELYSHLQKRPDFETSELYSSLRKRVDVDDPIYNELKDRRDMLEKNPSSLPSTEQTPGEVIELVLRALRDVDWPHPAHGIEVLRNYSGTGSVLGAPPSSGGSTEVTAQLLLEYFETTKYSILLEWVSIQYLKKLDLSVDRKRALQQIRLTSGAGDSVPVTFQLSKYQRPEGEVWLIDQLLVKT